MKEGLYNWHLLPYHSLDTAAVMKLLTEEIRFYNHILQDLGFVKDQDALSILLLLSATHDIGKYSESFQNLIPEILFKLQARTSTKEYPVRHDALGQILIEKQILPSLLKNSILKCILFDPDDDPDDWKDILMPLLSSAASHHGEPRYVDTPLKHLFSQENIKDALDFVKAVSLVFFPLEKDVTYIPCVYDDFQKTGRLSWVVAGLITLSDWISSRSDWFEHYSEPMDLCQYWETIALPSARNALAKTGLLPPKVSHSVGMHHLFPDIPTPNAMQNLAETCPLDRTSHLILIEDLCGNGKTEAALVLAHRLMLQGAEGLFFALPTMATANAMYRRVEGFYERLFNDPNLKATLILTHSASHFILGELSSDKSPVLEYVSYRGDEKDSNEESAVWLSDSRKKAFLAQVGIGTIDQALIGVLPIRHQSLRVLGLCRNVLIIDEVHSYDPYVQTLICKLIEFHIGLGGSVILISATLPLSARQEYVQAYAKGRKISHISVKSMDYPLLTVISENGTPQEHPLVRALGENNPDKLYEISTYSHEYEIIEEIRNNVKKNLCTVWIRNTVDDAVSSYRKLVQEFGTEKVSLFHARFTLHDRLSIENAVLDTFGKKSQVEERSGKILLATQVVEQSLDVDFDLLITDLAPIELMIQRAGRAHRHILSNQFRRSDRGSPRMIVYAPELKPDPPEDWYSRIFSKAAYVYQDHGRLYLSLTVLLKRKTVRLPYDMRPMIEEVYGEKSLSTIPPGLITSTLKEKGRRNGDASVGMMNALSFDGGYVYDHSKWADDVITPTRLSELSVPVFFGRWSEQIIHPLYGSGVYGWNMSKIMINTNKISRSASEEELSIALKTGLPGGGHRSILMIMKPIENRWTGIGWNESGKRIEVFYDITEGFSLADQD